MKKKLLSLLAFMVAMAMMLSACSSRQAPAGGDTSGELAVVPAETMSVTAVPDTLTVGERGEPSSLDPQFQNNSPSGFACMQIYETLIARDNNTMEFKPQLAESWEYLNDTTIRFHLRKDVKFHDGSPFTAKDVKFTLMRGKDSSYKGYSFDPFDCDASKVVDDYTFDLVTKGKFAPAFDFLVGNAMLIVSENAINSAASLDEYGRAPNGGTGPWVFKEWIADDRIVYERNENYWGEKPAFKTLVIRNISDDTTRALSLESGDIDVCIDVAPAQIEAIEASGKADIIRFPSFVNHYMGFNTQHKPLNDVRVRQALRYALDLEAMTDVAYGGVGEPSDSIFTKALSCYVPAPPELTYTYDVEKAKQLLKEAGYENGFEINLWVNENQTRIDMAEMLQNAWGKIGVKTNVEVMEFASYLEKIYRGEHDAYIVGFTSGGNDGDFMHDNLYSTKDYNSNSEGYKNPEWDRLMDAARQELDQEKRLEYYAEAQNITRKDLPWIPLRCGEQVYGVRSTLTGMDRDAQSKPQMKFVKPKN